MSTIELTRVPRRLTFPRWAVAVTLLWLSLIGVFEIIKRHVGAEGTLCGLRRVTGLPCPTCGSTRLVLSTLSGDVAGAFLYNPLVFCALSVLAAILFLRFAFGRALRMRLSPGQKRVAWVALSLLFLVNWAYVIWRDGPFETSP